MSPAKTEAISIVMGADARTSWQAIRANNLKLNGKKDAARDVTQCGERIATKMAGKFADFIPERGKQFKTFESYTENLHCIARKRL